MVLILCTMKSLEGQKKKKKTMKYVSYLPEMDLIGLGYDLNFEIKKNNNSLSDSNKPTILEVTALYWVLVAQLCTTLCNPMDCSLPGSSVHEIPQARMLEWVAILFSRGSSRPRD